MRIVIIYWSLIFSVALNCENLFGQASDSTENPIAILKQKKGVIKALTRGKWIEINLWAHLYKGEKVRTEPESEATILFWNGKERVVPQNQTIIIQEIGEPSLQWWTIVKAVVKKMSAIPTEEDLSPTGVIRDKLNSIREKEMPILLRPRNTNVMSTQLVFEWTPVEGEVNYTISLWDNKKIICDTTISKTKITLGNNLLEDGKKYQWHVKAQQDDMLYTSKDISFTILSSQQKKELQMMVNGLKGLLGQSENNPSNRSLIGAIFEESGLYLDAEREYKAAIKLNPKEPKFHVLLGDLYFKLELYELAEREFKTFFKP